MMNNNDQDPTNGTQQQQNTEWACNNNTCKHRVGDGGDGYSSQTGQCKHGAMPPDRTISPPLDRRRWVPTSNSQREAGGKLFEHTISLYARCKLSAKDFSTAM
eukprot:7417249-Pyramimonas_sp.AAC.1